MEQPHRGGSLTPAESRFSPRNDRLTRREQKAKVGRMRSSPAAVDDLLHALRASLPAELAERLRAGAAPDEASALPRLATGIAALDALLGGGFPRGRVSEITGPLSSGRTAIAHALLAAATRNGEIAAVVDAADAFDPESAAAAGVDLSRVLWARPSRAARSPALRRAPARSARLRRRGVGSGRSDRRPCRRIHLVAHEPQRDGERHGAGARRVVPRARAPSPRSASKRAPRASTSRRAPPGSQRSTRASCRCARGSAESAGARRS